MKKYLLGLITVVSLMGTASYAATESFEFDSSGLRAVTVDNYYGNVAVLTTDAPKATVIATKNVFSDDCRMTVARVGITLVVEVERTHRPLSAGCNVDFKIAVPKESDLNVTLGAGSLLVNEIQGVLAFKVGSGNVLADGRFKKIDGETGSGNVDVSGMTGGGVIRTGSGGIELTYAVSSLKGELELRTGTGNATLNFPKGTKVKTQFVAGSGQLSNELGDTPEASFKVSMQAGSGNLSIRSF